MMTARSKYERIVNGIAVGCLIAVMAIGGLRLLPAAFIGAQQLGDILFDFCMAYLAAWVFNVLVVTVPRRRQQRAAFFACQEKLGRLTNLAESLRQGLRSASEPTQAGAGEVNDRKLLAATAYEAPLYLIPEASGALRQGSWKEYFEFETSLATAAFTAVEIPALLFFDFGLYSASRAVIDHALVTRHGLMWGSESGRALIADELTDLARVCASLEAVTSRLKRSFG